MLINHIQLTCKIWKLSEENSICHILSLFPPEITVSPSQPEHPMVPQIDNQCMFWFASNMGFYNVIMAVLFVNIAKQTCSQIFWNYWELQGVHQNCIRFRFFLISRLPVQLGFKGWTFWKTPGSVDEKNVIILIPSIKMEQTSTLGRKKWKLITNIFLHIKLSFEYVIKS